MSVQSVVLTFLWQVFGRLGPLCQSQSQTSCPKQEQNQPPHFRQLCIVITVLEYNSMELKDYSLNELTVD